MLRHNLPKLVLPLVLVTLCTCAFGVEQAAQKSSIVKYHTFHHTTYVNRTMIKPGEYRIVVSGDKVKIEAEPNDNVIAEARVTREHSSIPYIYTRAITHNGVLTKIDLGGTREAIVLPAGRAAAS